MRQKLILFIAAVGFLAITGCNRGPAPASMVIPAAGVAPVNINEPANNYTADEEPAYGTRPPVRTISPQQFETPQYPQQPYSEAPPPYEARHGYADRGYYERRPRVVTRQRPFSHSAAIVGGSAGAGAVIGALAGGGRGAGIGALAGGGAGFIYDRLTHKKRVVETNQ